MKGPSPPSPDPGAGALRSATPRPAKPEHVPQSPARCRAGPARTVLDVRISGRGRVPWGLWVRPWPAMPPGRHRPYQAGHRPLFLPQIFNHFLVTLSLPRPLLCLHSLLACVSRGPRHERRVPAARRLCRQWRLLICPGQPGQPVDGFRSVAQGGAGWRSPLQGPRGYSKQRAKNGLGGAGRVEIIAGTAGDRELRDANFVLSIWL